MPKKKVDIDTGGNNVLPFLSTTNLFIEKVRSCGERSHDSDATDVCWIWTHLHADLDLRKIKKKLSGGEGAAAARNHSDKAGLLEVLAALKLT